MQYLGREWFFNLISFSSSSHFVQNGYMRSWNSTMTGDLPCRRNHAGDYFNNPSAGCEACKLGVPIYFLIVLGGGGIVTFPLSRTNVALHSLSTDNLGSDLLDALEIGGGGVDTCFRRVPVVCLIRTQITLYRYVKSDLCYPPVPADTLRQTVNGWLIHCPLQPHIKLKLLCSNILSYIHTWLGVYISKYLVVQDLFTALRGNLCL